MSFLFYPPTLNVEKKKWGFCLCIFESDTVKNDFRKMMKYLKI